MIQALFRVCVGTALLATAASCTTAQAPYECAAQNNELYKVRYFPQKSDCSPDGGFITGALAGTTAGMQTYMLVSLNGSGGPSVVFRDEPGNLDRSATKLGLRLNTLLEAKVPEACDDDFSNNCAEPDDDFDCSYCVNGDGEPTAPFTFADGKPAEDARLPDGTRQGVQVALVDGGTKRISLANACVVTKEGLTRTSSETPDPNLFVMLPRYGTNGVCRTLDAGIASSTTVFPKYTCKDGTTFGLSTIKTQLSNFAILASSTVPGSFAQGTISFTETNATGSSCSSVYKVAIIYPIIQCETDLDCSPYPVPEAKRCTSATPATTDHCFTGDLEVVGTGASNLYGSGVNPFLFSKFPDGGYDVRNTCDPVLKRCIWDADAGF